MREGWKNIYHQDSSTRDSRYTLVNQIDHLCDVVAGKAKPKVSGNDGLQSLKIFAAIIKSSKTGKKSQNLTLPPSILIILPLEFLSLISLYTRFAISSGLVGLVIFAALDLSFKILEVLFFVNFDSAFNNFSSLLVKVIPGLIMETETLSIFPCKAKLLEKWFKAEFTAPPIINVRNGFSQAPAPPPILIILPLYLFKVGQNIFDNLKADLNFKLNPSSHNLSVNFSKCPPFVAPATFIKKLIVLTFYLNFYMQIKI